MNGNISRNIRVAVSQYGSRRRYLIPELLNNAGLLQYLFTDAYRNSVLGSLCRILEKLGIRNGAITRLIKRKPNIPDGKVIANDFWQTKCILSQVFNLSHYSRLKIIFQGGTFGYKKRYLGKCDWLYTMFIENIHLVKYAKSHGVKVLADIYENPFIFSELSKELEVNPEYRSLKGQKDIFEAHTKIREKAIKDILELADIYLLPSEYVNESIAQCPTYDKSKAHIIPYVSSVDVKPKSNEPIKGRIIWIGNDPVRKGLVYVLRAFRELKKEFPFVELVIIGPIPNQLRHDPYFEGVTFTGYLDKSHLIEEFQKADIYVFPTLAEGFAGTLLEAAAYGVPIITTHASGFANDAPCIFVDTQNSAQIVAAARELIINREKRMQISDSLVTYSTKSNRDQFSSKLIDLLTTEESRIE